MLWTICVILLILWLLGLVSGYTMGGVVHVLLVIAIFVLVVQLIQERTQAYVRGEFVHVQYAEVREGLRFSLNKIK